MDERKIWEYLKSCGLNDYGVAGLMGNMYAESGLIPNNLQNTFNKSLNMTDEAYTKAVDKGTYTNFVYDKAGYGLVQWTFWSLKKELYDYALSKGKSIGDGDMQLEFLVKQLQKSYPKVFATLCSAKSVREASDKVLLDFERPANQGVSVQEKRANYGQQYYNKFAATVKPVAAQGGNTMKYSTSNKPTQCFMTQSTWYKGAGTVTVKGVLWHSTGANNPNIKRYVQPDDKASNRAEMLKLLGTNTNKNDWNHINHSAGVHAWIGKLANGSVTSIHVGPWDKKAWGCGSGSKGSCNDGWIQFEICEDNLADKNYFNAVYKEACELTAYLCQLYNLNPKGTVKYNNVNVPVILCHADSHALGLGSNHGDVLHWFKKYGKTMDDVRNDVAALLGSTQSTTSKPTGSATPTYKYAPRLTRPVAGNKYYMRKSSGGYSYAIAGKCKNTGKPDSQCDVLANCVGYAYGRFNEIGGYGYCKYLSPVNAERFPEYASGLKTGTEPKLGAVICWQKGGTLNGSDGAGHVAIVEQIIDKDTILISQSGYNSNVFWTEQVKRTGGQWRPSWMGSTYKFRCFIYNPAVPDSASVVPATSPTNSTGSTVNYTGIVTASVLNCRSGAGTGHSIVTQYTNGTKVTITKEQNGWGYTGKGWVSLQYIKKDDPIKVGDVIKIKAGSKYTTGKSIPQWVLNSTLYARAINSNGTITFSTLKTGAITGVVNASQVSKG